MTSQPPVPHGPVPNGPVPNGGPGPYGSHGPVPNGGPGPHGPHGSHGPGPHGPVPNGDPGPHGPGPHGSGPHAGPAAGERPARRRRWAPPVLAALVLAGLVAAGAVAIGGSGPTGSAADDLDTFFLTTDVGAGEPVDAAGAPAAGGQAFAGEESRADRRAERRANRPWRLAEGEHVVAGTVASRTGSSVVVTKDSGGDVTVPTDGDTTVAGARNRAVSDLDAGERVLVRTGTDGVADRVLVVRAHAAGTVTATDGDRATVTRPGGLTVTLDLSGVEARPAVGTVVVAVGTPADGGATLAVEALREVPALG